MHIGLEQRYIFSGEREENSDDTTRKHAEDSAASHLVSSEAGLMCTPGRVKARILVLTAVSKVSMRTAN